MPKRGQPAPNQVTPGNRAAKKKAVLEKIAEGATLAEAADHVGISRRVLYDWRHGSDEKFKVAFHDAYEASTDKLKKMCWELAADKEQPAQTRALMLFFLMKQRDPTFRDNNKVEHSVAPGLGKTLTELAKLADQG